MFAWCRRFSGAKCWTREALNFCDSTHWLMFVNPYSDTTGNRFYSKTCVVFFPVHLIGTLQRAKISFFSLHNYQVSAHPVLFVLSNGNSKCLVGLYICLAATLCSQYPKWYEIGTMFYDLFLAKGHMRIPWSRVFIQLMLLPFWLQQNLQINFYHQNVSDLTYCTLVWNKKKNKRMTHQQTCSAKFESSEFRLKFVKIML